VPEPDRLGAPRCMGEEHKVPCPYCPYTSSISAVRVHKYKEHPLLLAKEMLRYKNET
jgi:hypothetical protein